MRLPIQACSIPRGAGRRKPPARVNLSSNPWNCVISCIVTDFTLQPGLTQCLRLTNASGFISCIQSAWAKQEPLVSAVMFRGMAQCALQCLQ